jgi:uncharacterized heparinase superfamily protein
MNLLERLDTPGGGEEIEPGRQTIRQGGGRGFPLLERLTYYIRRIFGFLPFHGLRLRGRAPLKLLFVPKDPVAGDKAAGEAILAGRIVYGSQTIRIEGLDFTSDTLDSDASDYLQSFTWLRDLAAAATRENGAHVAEYIVRRWLTQCSEQGNERAWRVDIWARRIFFWTAYAPYILSAHDSAYRALVLKALVSGSRHIDRNADRAPLGLARISAWTGAVISALAVQGGATHLGKSETGLIRALYEASHDDGGLISRSLGEQLVLVELLSQLRAVYYAGRREAPEEISEALASATAALLAVTLGDGGLGSWQGGNMLSRRRVVAAVDASALDIRPLRQPRGWGYHRLSAKSTILIIDAAPPPPSRAIKGGCASTLAFEMSDGPDRLIVNCGGVGENHVLAEEIVQALRTTAAHSTLILGDRNSTAIYEDGTLGKGVTTVEVSRDETGGNSKLEANHDGYVRRFGLVHRRRIELVGNGLELIGEDRLERRGRRRFGNSGFAIRFHLGPSVEVTSTADGQGALLRIRGGAVWQFRCAGGVLSSEESLWIDGSGYPRGAQQLVVTGEVGAEGSAVTWSLKRAG